MDYRKVSFMEELAKIIVVALFRLGDSSELMLPHWERFQFIITIAAIITITAIPAAGIAVIVKKKANPTIISLINLARLRHLP